MSTDEITTGMDFITIGDLSRNQLLQVLQVARTLKEERKGVRINPILKDKILAMIFEKPSLRTRVSFEVGIKELGGSSIVLTPSDIGMGLRETVEDISKVLSRYVHGIMARTFSHSSIVELAKHAEVPVINGLSDFCHPCQVIGDLLTIREHLGSLENISVAFIGDGNNVAVSWIFASALLGIDFRIACPEGYEPSGKALDFAEKHNQPVKILRDPIEAAREANVLYTDVWASMGQEDEKQARMEDFTGFQVNERTIEVADRDVIVMHCLPAHYGEEITYQAAHGEHSVIFDQAENRLHAQKAIMALIM